MKVHSRLKIPGELVEYYYGIPCGTFDPWRELGPHPAHVRLTVDHAITGAKLAVDHAITGAHAAAEKICSDYLESHAGLKFQVENFV